VRFLLTLLIDGALAGAIYALIALSLIIVFRAMRMINFALGEWVTLGPLLVAFFWNTLGMDAIAALMLATASTIVLALAFSRLVLSRLVGRPLIALIMVTLGLGAAMRGTIAVLFGDSPRALPFELPREPIQFAGLEVATPKLIAALIATLCIAGLGSFLQRSRTGIALRALAADPQAAMAVGINIHRHFAITWALAGVVSMAAGVLWTLVSGGGAFGLQLLGLKVFPIVVIGGLDSIAGTIVAAVAVGAVESLVAGYLGPVVGYGVGGIAASVLLLVVLMVRPHGLFGQGVVGRV
jgi:branched-chain amino acid transport system permease protein